MIRAFFQEKRKVLQSQFGRSAGKTEAAIYIAWRFAIQNPGSEIYIICPEKLQGKKIYWLPRRLQYFGPQDMILEHRESELRTVFTNGSYIIIDGCENYESLRGIKPDLVIYDEFQHHTPYFDEEVMQPNLSSGNVSLLVFGTPPKRHCHYVDFREDLLQNLKGGDPTLFYLEVPSEANPTLDREWLRKKKADLIRREKTNVWLREYEGKLVFDTESALYPFFDEKKHVFAHEFLLNLIKRDKSKLNWYGLYDPGTTTVFAGLFLAHNPYTSQIFILDEIYATEKRDCTSHAIYTTAQDKKSELYDDLSEWTEYYDEAAAWFANEVESLFPDSSNLLPTHKLKHKAQSDEGRAGESMLNTAMMEEKKFFVSSRCEKFIWEIQNYVLDVNGQYPKTHDHLMDLIRYFSVMTNYTVIEDVDPTDFRDEYGPAERRGRETIEDVVASRMLKNDLSHGLGEIYFDDDPGEGIEWN